MASNAKDFDKEKLPELLNGGNLGTEFYLTFIPCWEGGLTGNDLKIYVSSQVRTKVTVEVPGKSYMKEKYTVPNDIIEFTLAPAIGQPYRKSDRDIPYKDSIYSKAGVHIYSEAPIICVAATRFQYTSDAFLVLPVPVLGKEYIVASYADPSPNTIQYLPSYTGIVSPYDNNEVRFTMGGTDWSKTTGGLMPGETKKYILQKGDVLLIAGLGSHAELTGSKVEADKPVGVVSGNFCAYIPTNCGNCDFLEEMEIPTDYWGYKYHVPRIVNRLKNSIIKIFAKESKTKIFRDCQQIGFLRIAGGTEQNGYLHLRADEGKPRPIVISGDKPINVTLFNCAQQDDGIESDPFQMVLVPVEQYQKEIVFHTPGIPNGYGFPNNYINLCYEATPYGTIPDDLMFATATDGKFSWTQLKDMSPVPGEPFEKCGTEKTYYSKTLLLPGDGVYSFKANTAFCAYSYGFSSYDSYGYPSSFSLQSYSFNDHQAPFPYWTMESNGNVNIATKNYAIDQPSDVTRSNMKSIVMDSTISFNYRLMVGNYVPCVDSSAEWGLVRINQYKDAFAVVTFSDCAGNDTTLTFFFDYQNDNYGYDKFCPVPSWVSDLYGNINKDTTMYVVDKPDYDEIRSNLDTIFLNTEKSYNYELFYQSFEKCKEQKTWWKLMRTDISKNSHAEVTFRDCIGNDTTLIFDYKAILDTLPPAPEWIQNENGNVNEGITNYVEDMPKDEQIRSNLNNIQLNDSVSYNYSLVLGKFSPCIDYKTNWQLTVIDADEDARAVVTFSDCAGNDTTLTFTYNSKIDKEPPEPIWSMDESGNVNVYSTNYVTDKPDKPERRKNLDSIVLDKNLSFNYRLFFDPFTRCIDQKTYWSLVIMDSKIPARAVVKFSDCAQNDTTLTINYNPTDVKEQNSSNIRIFPIPANDYIHLTGLPEGKKQFKIFDVLGNERINYELPITNYEFVINVSDLPLGVYYIQIIDGKDIKMVKITIVR